MLTNTFELLWFIESMDGFREMKLWLGEDDEVTDTKGDSVVIFAAIVVSSDVVATDDAAVVVMAEDVDIMPDDAIGFLLRLFEQATELSWLFCIWDGAPEWDIRLLRKLSFWLCMPCCWPWSSSLTIIGLLSFWSCCWSKGVEPRTACCIWLGCTLLSWRLIMEESLALGNDMLLFWFMAWFPIIPDCWFCKTGAW